MTANTIEPGRRHAVESTGMKRILQLTLLVGLLAPGLLRAGGDEVVVVYNQNVPESRVVAEHYAQMRQVPKSQVFGFALTTDETMTRQDFRKDLQWPLAEKLEAKKIWRFGPVKVPGTNGAPDRTEARVVRSKIRYLVLCYGVPLKIQADANLQENIPPGVPTELQRNDAAVDSELTWLPLIKTTVPLYGPLNNPFYGATNATLLNPTNGILLVARLDGPTAEIANHLVDKAVAAETNGLWGRAYFDARGLSETNTSYILGDQWMKAGAELCSAYGFETILDDRPETFPADFPMSQIAIYAGWYAGDADGPFAQPTVEFMPGAFAYHLYSYSAASLRTATQHWCGPLLAKGATVTMGCVNEPYLAGTPNVPIFLSRWIGAGFTFGEAAWAAQSSLSWQTTVVGDPLYRPFNKRPAVWNEEFMRTHNPLAEWSLLRMANLARNRGMPLAAVAQNLESIGLTAHSAVLTEKFADLCKEQGKPASAIDYYQRALTLKPSPEQRIRIRLELGGLLADQGDYAGAIANDKKLLQEDPGYPGRGNVGDALRKWESKLAATNTPAK